MHNSHMRLRAILLGGTMVVAIFLLAVFSSSVTTATTVRPQAMKPHMDHHPKHGGIFFMALDEKHHLEGLLLPTGTFCVYVYDAYTKPVSLNQLRQVSATVIWGDADNAPRTRMAPSKDGRRLESVLGSGRPKLPITLTLLAHFPGESPKARPELFTFPFKTFVVDRVERPANSGDPSVGHSMHMAGPHGR
jgi:hypothetical protein